MCPLGFSFAFPMCVEFSSVFFYACTCACAFLIYLMRAYVCACAYLIHLCTCVPNISEKKP